MTALPNDGRRALPQKFQVLILDNVLVLVGIWDQLIWLRNIWLKKVARQAALSEVTNIHRVLKIVVWFVSWAILLCRGVRFTCSHDHLVAVGRVKRQVEFSYVESILDLLSLLLHCWVVVRGALDAWLTLRANDALEAQAVILLLRFCEFDGVTLGTDEFFAPHCYFVIGSGFLDP